MRATKNNHLFISASISLILIAFFITIAKDKTDIMLVKQEPKIDPKEVLCKDILENGLSLELKNNEASNKAMNKDNTRLEEILEPKSLAALKSAAICLGRSSLEVNIDQFVEGLSLDKDLMATMKILNKVHELLNDTLGKSTAYKNINLNVVKNINLDSHDE